MTHYMRQYMSMFPLPLPAILQNTYEFESLPLVKPTGFREYDARWLFEDEINLLGMQYLGLGIATLLEEFGVEKKIVLAHDFRGYSASIKMALMSGLLAGGCEVHDIGLALTPIAYFAQFELDVPAVAMVTASHNDNGWTGVKMGMQRPLTYGPKEMGRLKEIVLNAQFTQTDGGGKLIRVNDMPDRYSADLTNRKPFKRKMKAVVACGNGTAGAFAPKILEKLGVEVIPLHTDLDHTFPNHNPNPEDLAMLHAVADAVKEYGADVGLAFDGDGDRCGVVDNTGDEIFADKVGVLLAREISADHPNSLFVVDVKSTGLFSADPILQKNGAKVDYWKTGHSHIKRRNFELGAIAAFEKSGHFFLNAPYGKGYDDGIVTAIIVLDMLDRNPDKTVEDLKNSLPKTWQSPTMSPKCADEIKYDVIDRAVDYFQKRVDSGEKIAGQAVADVITVNGIRIALEDGTWGLVRASSNKPELVVVVESPTSEANMRAIFAEIDGWLEQQEEVGEYNQKI